MKTILVIDVGTTGLRASLVDDTLAVQAMEYRSCPPSTPFPGLVEFDGAELAAKLLDAARTVLATTKDPVVAVGITNQRASTLVWDRNTGEPVGPGLGWQDLRTVGECIMAKLEHGWSVAPNQSSTKAGWILANTSGLEGRDLCVGTIDSWIAWTLSEGALHVSDQTNASATTNGLRVVDGSVLPGPVGANPALTIAAFADLVADDVILGIIKEVLSQPAYVNGAVLDGVVRTVPQAAGLEKVLSDLGRSLGAVLVFDIPDEEIIERISGRLTCDKCSAPFTGREPGIACDALPCSSGTGGGVLVRRKDDEPDAVKTRLDAYRKSTEPVLAWYIGNGTRVATINAVGPVDEITERARLALGL